MKIKDIALSAAAIGERVVKATAIGAVEVWSAIKYIVFADPVVEQICVANFSSDGVVVLPEDAAKVTDLRAIFKGNTEITSFDELAEFTGLKVMGENFSNCTNLKRITIPSTVSTLGFSTFRNCTSLESIGSDLSHIVSIDNQLTFNGCSNLRVSLNMINLEQINPYGGQFSYSGIVEVLSLGKITKIPVNMFNSCSNLRKVVLHNGITSIGDNVFNMCTNLVDINLNIEGLVSIGNSAFISVPFTFLELPSTITLIGGSAFRYCSDLTTVVLNSATPPTIEILTFANGGIQEFYVPDQSVQAYREASVWLNYADKIKPLSQYVES